MHDEIGPSTAPRYRVPSARPERPRGRITKRRQRCRLKRPESTLRAFQRPRNRAAGEGAARRSAEARGRAVRAPRGPGAFPNTCDHRRACCAVADGCGAGASLPPRAYQPRFRAMSDSSRAPAGRSHRPYHRIDCWLECAPGAEQVQAEAVLHPLVVSVQSFDTAPLDVPVELYRSDHLAESRKTQSTSALLNPVAGLPQTTRTRERLWHDAS